jgi:imidazolonepropionase-like amidohydrolase
MTLRLTGARIWDGTASTTPAEATDLVIEGGRIAALGSPPEGEKASGWSLPAGAVAIPGLIDAHVHLDLDPHLLAPDDQFKASRADRDLRMIARARAMVRAGITTARDLGAGEWRELALRDAVARGELPGPRLLCAGQPLTIAKGHCHFWGGVAEGADEQAEVVRRQLERGVDWVKIMATGGYFTKGSGVDRAQFSAEEIRRAVGQASEAGLSVAAHCHGKAGIRNAARGGVRTLEHCSFASSKGYGADYDADIVKEVASQGAWVSPTVNGNWLRRMEKDGKPTDFFRNMQKVLGALGEAGVPLMASTDAGIPGVLHHGLAAGLRALEKYTGRSPVDVLRTATSDSARGLGIEDVCGRLAPGLSADVLVLAADPLEDLARLEEPLLVLAAGRVVYRDASLPDPPPGS